MYDIHTTPGFVIGSRPYSEADKLMFVLTKDFGMVTAVGKGIRFEKSKLRFKTQDYSFGNFSFVKGKEFWRITDVTEVGMDACGRAGEALMGRLAFLLKKLLHGEEPNRPLFDALYSCRLFLSENRNISNEQLLALESMIVARILDRLGYIGDDADIGKYIKTDQMSVDLLDEVVGKKTVLNKHINKALRESHLVAEIGSR